ncbi:ABC transporter substrate-binding protein [Bacillus massiliigorillae]|uniref:ABC transporter substrate-binding protein n=1 Tax=Bacillus massiliigorillae TaxID=1243664 RepID=UPI000693CAFD|nr:ABC transporter substrate-binding protein [Bacillus massiliigorillae]
MKRKINAWIFLLVCICVTVSACSNKKDEEEVEDVKKENPFFAFEADNGIIDVPENPQKIVVLSTPYVGYLLQLGIHPVAVPKLAFENPYFKGMLEGTEAVSSDALEEIMMLEPDLIIAEISDESIEDLQGVAPTVAFDWDKRNYLQKMMALGHLVRKEKEAEAWLAKWEEKVTINKDIVQKFIGNKTISIMQQTANGVNVYGNQAGHGGEVIYDALELKAPQLVQHNIIDRVPLLEVPIESIPHYAGDYIYLSTSADANNNPVQNSTIWMNLPAVKNNRVFLLDERTASFSDPITLDKMMDKIVKDLTQSQ